MAVSEQELMDMNLHEKMKVGSVDIQRVIGGWIYWYRRDASSEIEKASTSISCSIAGVFVPEK